MANPEKVTDVFLITKRFKNSTDFSQHIERTAVHTRTSCMDVLLDYCVKNEIEIEGINKFLSSSLKEKLQVEAQELNLLKIKANTNKLPF
jgi:hypothetical protein